MSINQSMIDQFNTFEQNTLQSLSAMRKTLGLGALSASAISSAKPAKASAKSKKASASDSASATSEPKPPSAWNVLVAQTVTDMKQNGWASWTDLKGNVWPASRSGVVKDKSGADFATFVYDGGANDGKMPSPALGGMVRASYLKAQTDPVAMATAKKYHEKLAEKRSASGSSVGTAEKEAPVADEPKAEKKVRKPQSEETKAAAAAKRAATKAAKALPAEEAEFEDVSPAPVAVAPLVTPTKPKKVVAPAAPVKKMDLSWITWQFEGKDYLTNDRRDVVDPEEGTWVGRYNGTIIDETIPEPDDIEGIEMRD
jgi:hypothetical protein